MRMVAATAAKVLAAAALAGVLGGTPALAQDGDVNKIMADLREALGGKKLDSVKTLTVEGRTLRTNAAGTTTEHAFEMAMELPDKYMRKDVLSPMGNMSVYRTTGFNGDGLINEIDTPPQLSGGGHIVMRFQTVGGPGGQPTTPEQQEAARKNLLANTKKDYARIVLGMLGTSPAAYPLTFTYAGVAESPDGKADVIDIKGEGDFAARLFVDTQTHLPLMLSWMDKEPMVVQRMVSGGPGGGAPPPPPPPGGGHASVAGAGGGNVTFSSSGGNVQVRQGGAPLTPEEQAKIDAQIKEAEATRRTVEFRLFYSDYQQVDGVLMPHRFQRSVDGKPTEEVVFERIKVNSKIDAKKFTVSKQ